MGKPVKVIGGIALLLLLVSLPTCYVGEMLVRPELAKLSPEELELKRFNLEYVVYVLPGIALFLTGGALAVAAAALGITDYLVGRRKKGAGS